MLEGFKGQAGVFQSQTMVTVARQRNAVKEIYKKNYFRTFGGLEGGEIVQM